MWIINVLGYLDAAVFAHRQDAVVVQQGFRAGLFVRFDDVFEQDPVLELDRDGFFNARVDDDGLAFNRREDSDIDLIGGSGRSIRPDPGSGEQQRSQPCCRGSIASNQDSPPPRHQHAPA
jgi:hypothetical protein